MPAPRELGLDSPYNAEAGPVFMTGIQAHDGVAEIFRDVRVRQIYEGASDIQRLVIARQL